MSLSPYCEIPSNSEHVHRARIRTVFFSSENCQIAAKYFVKQTGHTDYDWFDNWSQFPDPLSEMLRVATTPLVPGLPRSH